jgi:hypothetical protein
MAEVVCESACSRWTLSHSLEPARCGMYNRMNNMKNLLEPDDYTEVLPDDEMDQDLKKALKEMAESITLLGHRQTGSPAQVPELRSAGEPIESKLGVLEERLKWHRNIGWGIAGLYGAALAALVTFWIPREATNIETSVKLDTAHQLLPIQIQLATLTGIMQLKQSKDVALAIQQSANFATPIPAIEAIKTIAQQAKEEKLAVTPQVLQTANINIQRAVASDPQLKPAAWSARLALVDYRTSLQQPFRGNTVAGTDQELPFENPQLNVIKEFVYRNGTQEIDRIFWKDVVFENVRIVYHGGPMAMQNVRFINCTFIMNDTWRTDKLADLILDQNVVSGSLG